MAAVISTGAATDIVDLLQKLVTWLVVRGYTSNMSQAEGNNWRAHLNKGAIYLNFCASTFTGINFPWATNYSSNNNTGINFYLSSGFNASNGWNAQTGGPLQDGTSQIVGVCVRAPGAITSYQFIDDGNDNIFIVIENSPGVFRHLCWGSVTKAGSWTGGLYFSGECPGYYCSLNSYDGIYKSYCPFSSGWVGADHRAFVLADIDAFTGKWLSNGTGIGTNKGYTGKLFATGIVGKDTGVPTDIPVIDAISLSRLVSALSGRIITVPVTLFAKRDASGYSALGEVPSLRLCSASEHGFTVGTDVSIGSETYRIFNGYAVRIA